MNSDKGRSRKKERSHNKTERKRFLLAMMAAVLLGASATGTSLAYLVAGTNEITNQFEGAAVKGKVEEVFDNYEKKNVKVKNIGSTDAYVRVVLVPNWVNQAGEVYKEAPEPGKDYQLDIPAGNGWSLGSDGFYYYTRKVAPESSTEVLVELCKPLRVKEDENGNELHFELHVAASLIQARPDEAVKQAWGEEAYRLVTSGAQAADGTN